MEFESQSAHATEFPKVQRFLDFSRHLFTILEWLLIIAAVTYAALKTSSVGLWILGYCLQLVLAIYVLLALSLWLRPRFKRLKSFKVRLVLGAVVVTAVALGGDWLVKDTVSRLVRTQLSSEANFPCILCQ